MEIVDAQLHDPAPWRAWDDPESRRNALTETLLAMTEAVGVDRVVLFPVEDPDWALEVAQEWPDRFAVVPIVRRSAAPPVPGPTALNIDAADVDERIEKVAGIPGVVAVRIAVAFWPEELRRLADGHYDRAFAACERVGVPVFFMISGHTEMTRAVAESFPKLSIIIDHIGLPQPPMEVRDTPPFARLPALLDLARYPNVAIKMCGAPALSQQEYPFADVKAPIRQIVDAFGAERLMWASDIGRFRGRIGWQLRVPGAEQPYSGKHTYAESLAFYRDTDLLSEREKELVLGQSARNWLRWTS
jgi:predicted TIM-barrel fold metal-dependent hydrolase